MDKPDVELQTNAKTSAADEQLDAKLSKRMLYIYMAVIFTVAFALIGLSYLTQVREVNEAQTLAAQNMQIAVGANSNIEKLQKENEELRINIERALIVADRAEAEAQSAYNSRDDAINAQKQAESFQKEAENALIASEARGDAYLAMIELLRLERSKEYAGCRVLIDSMEQSGQYELLMEADREIYDSLRERLIGD